MLIQSGILRKHNLKASKLMTCFEGIFTFTDVKRENEINLCQQLVTPALLQHHCYNMSQMAQQYHLRMTIHC